MRFMTAAACLLTITLIGCANNGGGPALQTDHAKAITATGSEYQQMPVVLTFESEAQKQELIKAAQVRDAGYVAWRDSERGKQYEKTRAELEAAKKANDAAKVTELTEAYKPLRAEQEKVREDLRRAFNKSLTLEQQKQWAGHSLYETTLATLRKPMTTQQKIDAHRICEQVARDSVNRRTIDKDPYLMLDKETQDKALAAVKAGVKGL